MIARIWTGAVRRGDAPDYLKLMREVAIPDYTRIAGHRGAWCLSRPSAETVIVSMLTFWTDMASIREFAGADADVAKYYDFDADYLVEAPTKVEHYEVFGSDLPPAPPEVAGAHERPSTGNRWIRLR